MRRNPNTWNLIIQHSRIYYSIFFLLISSSTSCFLCSCLLVPSLHSSRAPTSKWTGKREIDVLLGVHPHHEWSYINHLPSNPIKQNEVKTQLKILQLRKKSTLKNNKIKKFNKNETHKQWVHINIANNNEIITLQPPIKLQGLRPEI